MVVCVRVGCQCRCVYQLYVHLLRFSSSWEIGRRAYAIWDDRSQWFWHHCLLNVIRVHLGCQCRRICHSYHATSTYLDLVPLESSSDEFSLSGTIVRICFGIIPVDFHFCQILFNCLAPGLSRSSYVSIAAFRHPLHRNMC